MLPVWIGKNYKAVHWYPIQGVPTTSGSDWDPGRDKLLEDGGKYYHTGSLSSTVAFLPSPSIRTNDLPLGCTWYVKKQHNYIRQLPFPYPHTFYAVHMNPLSPVCRHIECAFRRKTNNKTKYLHEHYITVSTHPIKQTGLLICWGSMPEFMRDFGDS